MASNELSSLVGKTIVSVSDHGVLDELSIELSDGTVLEVSRDSWNFYRITPPPEPAKG